MMQQDIFLVMASLVIALLTCAILWVRLRKHSHNWQAQAAGQEAHLQTWLETVGENLETLTETAQR
jgi:hypothetical protein